MSIEQYKNGMREIGGGKEKGEREGRRERKRGRERGGGERGEYHVHMYTSLHFINTLQNVTLSLLKKELFLPVW